MPNVKKTMNLPLIADSILVILTVFCSYIYFASSVISIALSSIVYLVLVLTAISLKDLYNKNIFTLKNIWSLLESVVFAVFISSLISIFIVNTFSPSLVLLDIAVIFLGIIFIRTFSIIYQRYIKRVHNILIVGAGQDGKLIAEEIQSRPELKMKVVGFLDDNMNNIEEEDSSIPILGLTYDSEAVIKDNKVDTVIIAVKSRMDSNILTDLAKGIPLGVKVWRMPTFYSYITGKLFTSKMAVNWLFYGYVRPKYVIYSYIKRVLDIIMAFAILILTIPVTLIAIIGIKFSDFGPIFFIQTRIGKFGRPFKMLKLRTMYQDKVDEDFDDDLEEINSNDKRIIPFCRWVRFFHVDDIAQMFNVIKGDMSIVGPRPVREEVYEENKESIPFWECRNWVRPGWTGWQQIKAIDCTPEERLGYDLFYVKHRTLVWEFKIIIRYIFKTLFRI